MTKVRTRFAPSPTGYLHVGGLRTALYNYLFARRNGGVMVLRIEDTDQNRLVKDAKENLIRTLHLMGIDYDEGPDKGGDYGPYVQSERKQIYLEHAQKLLENGHAYYCFCTPERLEKMRAEQEAAKLQPKYDGHCLSLTPEEVQKKLAAGEPHVIRLKMPRQGETRFTDLIRGEVTVQNELVDDQILVKSDGFPTYHLANVVDDHLMGITHVIRGEEWLLSVPKHLQLYKAFGWEAPQMAHLPLLLNPDRSKLSKRQGDVAVEDFLAKGYLPEALNNYIALLGWNPGNDQEFFTLEELMEQFSLERVNKSGAVFDIQKLRWMNGQYIKQLPEEKRHEFLLPFLEDPRFSAFDEQNKKLIVDAFYKAIGYGLELKEKAELFIKDSLVIEEPELREMLKQESAKTVLSQFLEKVESLDTLDLNIFLAVMKSIQKETGIKKQELWMPIRVAITGVDHGPELPQVIQIMGKERISRFVRQVLEAYCN
ncbi:MAG: glutamate--tRNA ligase [Calditrichia bacterium]